MTTAKKVTLATVKSFIRKNKDNLFIATLSSFNGMTDGVDSCDDRGFTKVLDTTHCIDHTMGIQGAWFVGSSRDYFSVIDSNGFKGFHVFNSCGSFDIAVKA